MKRGVHTNVGGEDVLVPIYARPGHLPLFGSLCIPLPVLSAAVKATCIFPSFQFDGEFLIYIP